MFHLGCCLTIFFARGFTICTMWTNDKRWEGSIYRNALWALMHHNRKRFLDIITGLKRMANTWVSWIKYTISVKNCTHGLRSNYKQMCLYIAQRSPVGWCPQHCTVIMFCKRKKSFRHSAIYNPQTLYSTQWLSLLWTVHLLYINAYIVYN